MFRTVNSIDKILNDNISKNVSIIHEIFIHENIIYSISNHIKNISNENIEF